MFLRRSRLLTHGTAAFAAAIFALAMPALAQSEDGFEFEVKTIDGEELSHRDLMDKVVLIDFWGTWCPPCKKAIPHLIKLHEKYESKGLVILGLNYERGENPLKLIRAYADKTGIPYPLAIGTEEIKAQVENFGGFPTMLFFKRGMRLANQESGWTDSKAEAIEAWVIEALAEKAPPAKPVGPTVRGVKSRDGKVLAIGDGQTATLVVLTHPKAPADPALLAKLRALAEPHEHLRIATLTRDDIEGAKADYVCSLKELKSLRIGSAFPVYKFYNQAGNTVLTEAGRGEKVHAAVQRTIEVFLMGSVKRASSKQAKAAPKVKADGAKPAAKKKRFEPRPEGNLENMEKKAAEKKSAEKKG